MVCPSCGTQNPDDYRHCSNCGAMLPAPSTQPLAPATGPQPPAAATATNSAKAPGDRRLASLGDRLIALILDTILLGAVFAAAGMWTAVRWGGVTESGFEMSGKPALIAMGFVILVGFLYYWLFEGLFGATLGKGIVGIQVRDLGGGKCGLGASLIRNILRIIDALVVYLVGFLIAVFSKLRQRLGDHLARTVVVETATGKLIRAILVVLWLALLGGGIWGAIVIHRGAPAGGTTTTTTTTGTTTSGGSTTASSGGATATAPVVITSGDLKLQNFRFVEKEDGPPRPEGPYKPRDQVRAEWEVAGYTTDGQGRMNLQYSIESSDPNGLALYRVQREVQQAISSAKPLPMYFYFDLPRFVPAGTYKARVKVHDNVKNTDGELTAAFTVQAEPLPASTQLEIRDIHLSLSEDGPPADPAVIQAGSTIYLVGNLAGMQFREDRMDVRISFQLLDPSGEKVLDRPDFLTVSDTFSYHPPTFFVPISGHVSIPSGASKGTYKEKYTVTDRIANTTVNYELKFEVQ